MDVPAQPTIEYDADIAKPINIGMRRHLPLSVHICTGLPVYWSFDCAEHIVFGGPSSFFPHFIDSVLPVAFMPICSIRRIHFLCQGSEL